MRKYLLLLTLALTGCGEPCDRCAAAPAPLWSNDPNSNVYGPFTGVVWSTGDGTYHRILCTKLGVDRFPIARRGLTNQVPCALCEAEVK